MRSLTHTICKACSPVTACALATSCTMQALGRDYGGGLAQCEVDYLIRHEWARSADDILWRRTEYPVLDAAGMLRQSRINTDRIPETTP